MPRSAIPAPAPPATGGMLTRMLRADLRRTRTTSFVLTGLVALAALLAAMGGTVLVQLTGSLDRLFETARTPDVVQMHVGEIDVAAIESWATRQPLVSDVLVSKTLPIPVDELHLNGIAEADSVLQPALVTQNAAFDLLLGLDNEVLEIQPGQIALPVYYALQRGVQEDDRVSLRFPDATFDLTVVGFLRDSTMNPTFVTSKRLLVSEADHAAIAAHVAAPEYLVELLLHNSSDARAVSQAYGDSGLPTNGMRIERSAFYLFNAMSHGLVIGVLTLLAGLMVAVAVLAVRFSFLTAVARDLREIGVLKAIGLPARTIRVQYLAKYAALAVAGGLVGLLAAVPLTRTVTGGLRMQLGESSNPLLGLLVPTAAVAVVVAAVLGSCLLLLRRLDRVSAMDALRSQPSGRPGRTPRLRLARTKLPVPAWLGINDVARDLRTHGMLLTMLALCTFIMVVPLNLWTTATSPSFVTYMGTGVADVRLELRSAEAVAGSPALVADLGSDPEVARFSHLTTARFDVLNPDGKWESINVENGDHDQFALSYLRGSAPASAEELSLSTLAAKGLQLDVGDSFVVRGRNGEHRVELVGIYQDLTNGGRTAKGVLPVAGEPVVWQTVLLDVAEGGDAATVAARIAADHPGVQAIEMDEFAGQVLGEMVDQTALLTVVSALVALALAFLVASMFARLVIARDVSQIAVQRALGIPDRALRAQYLTRFLSVLVAGVVIGTVLVATFGQWLVAAALGSSLGAPAIRFHVDPLLAYAVFPIILAAVVAVATLLATRTFGTSHINQLSEE